MIRKFEQEGSRFVAISDNIEQDRRDTIRLMREQGCTDIRQREKYDIHTDQTELHTIGQ